MKKMSTHETLDKHFRRIQLMEENYDKFLEEFNPLNGRVHDVIAPKLDRTSAKLDRTASVVDLLNEKQLLQTRQMERLLADNEKIKAILVERGKCLVDQEKRMAAMEKTNAQLELQLQRLTQDAQSEVGRIHACIGDVAKEVRDNRLTVWNDAAIVPYTGRHMKRKKADDASDDETGEKRKKKKKRKHGEEDEQKKVREIVLRRITRDGLAQARDEAAVPENSQYRCKRCQQVKPALHFENYGFRGRDGIQKLTYAPRANCDDCVKEQNRLRNAAKVAARVIAVEAV